MAVDGIKKPDGTGVRISTSTPSKLEKLEADLREAKATFDDDEYSKLEEKVEIADYAEAKNHNTFLVRAEEAVQSIVDARNAQLELVQKAQEVQGWEQLVLLETEAESYNTEISRIATSATYNGQSVMNAATLSVQHPEADVAEVTGTAQVVSFLLQAEDVALTNLDRSEAAIKIQLKFGQIFRSELEGRVQESEDNLDTDRVETQAQKLEHPRTITDLTEAEQAAEAVHNQLLELAVENPQEAQQLAFHKQELNAEKILSLLGEG